MIYSRLFVIQLSLGIIAWAFCLYANGQCPAKRAVWDKLLSIEAETPVSVKNLKQVITLRKQFENCRLDEDSVYARLLHKEGLFEYQLNNYVATAAAIDNTLKSVRINTSGAKGSCQTLAVNSYFNLAIFYESLRITDKALVYYDSAILWSEKVPGQDNFMMKARKGKALILKQIGDYEKAIEECTLIISEAKKIKDSSMILAFYNQRGLIYKYQQQTDIRRSSRDIDSALFYARLINNNFELATALKTKGIIYAGLGQPAKASSFYKQAISARKQTGEYFQIADDYIDFGNFCSNIHDYSKARQCYLSALEYAKKANDRETMAKSYLSLGIISLFQANLRETEDYYSKAFQNLQIETNFDILKNPSAAQLKAINNKDLLVSILHNKADLALVLYKRSGQKKYLAACIKTSLLTDSVITFMRHEQSGEQSKLYWRETTRDLYTNAIEACYYAKDTLAFYFMEKSRAVLLTDKLKEIGASGYLPIKEAVKERELKARIITEQEKLNSLETKLDEYHAQLLKVAEAKDSLEYFIKSLERRYPAYYQYKYADEISSLSSLQKHLLKSKQSFVHYFINDTVAYVLSITPTGTRLLRLSKDKFNISQLVSLLKLCSDEQSLNRNYPAFTALSYSVYKMLFRPLNLPKGRVVICMDNIILPFEAFCTDLTGNNFLIKDYIFSYVYSARYLMKQYQAYPANGDFIGYAPVSFRPYLNVPDLQQSGKELKQSAHYYKNPKLYVNHDALRCNFISSIGNYTVANIFSHAYADTTNNSDPVFYMQDSVISLGELQLLHQPATNLVVLSACQTNVGKSAEGEGIFSLARGFAAAGIPSVAATLWKADQQSIYDITEKFHQYLSQGMQKDEALQKAKLHFLQTGGSSKQLPFYWANMILVGHTEPLDLSQNYFRWWWIGLPVIAMIPVILALIFFWRTSKDYGVKRENKILPLR